MAGKSYIKVGTYDWDRIKKMYIKTGGQTWSAVRKSYVKTSTGWRKVFDTASNRPFIAGNDIPKIRLNTFRTGSTYNPTGTLDDPVDPLVEAPPVQQMGPTWTSPTYGWPYESLGRHLWGYDGTWTSGNGTSMTFVYTWLYNLTGNSNDNTAELNATSTTGRTDMLTNLSSHLGQSDGDYFDKNFLTFRVTATNSAGNASAESAPVYIVREVPTGSITMVSPASASTNSTMSATFTYSNNWYNKTNISNSYIEWFAVDYLGETLTNSNRVQIDYLSSIAVTGTTSKAGTALHVPTIGNKYYYVKMTLNNSGTENAVIAITGFTPKSSVTSQSNKTVVTSAPLTAPSITSVSSTIEGAAVTAYFSGGSGPYYQIYWTTGVAPTVTVTPDAEGSSSPLTDNTGPSTTGYTWYMFVRSVSSLGETSVGPSSLASSWSSGYAFTVASGVLTAPTISSITAGNTGGPVSVYFSGGTGPFYQAYWTGNTAPTTAVTPDASGSSSPLTDNTGPSSTGTVYMYVRSVKTAGETSVGPSTLASSWSSGVTFNMTAPAPTNSTLPTLSPTSIAVGTTLTAGVGTWNNSPTSYDIRIYRGTANVSTGETLVASGSSTSLTYTVTQADYNSGQLYFKTYVNASNSGGSSGFVGGQERGPIATPLSTPSIPTGLSATTNRTTDVYLTWNASSGATTYEIWYGSPPLDSYTPDFYPGSATYYFDNGISQGSSRTYYVRARNSAGASGWSSGATGTRTAPVSTPVPVLSSISGNNSLALGGTFSWSYTNSPTGYSILCQGPSGTVYTTSNAYNYGSTTFRPGYDGYGWQGAGNYTIYVSATNSGGNSVVSSLTTYMS